MPAPSHAVTKLWASFLILVLGYPFIVSPAREVWANYWILRDGRQVRGVITGEPLFANGTTCIYHYRVNGKTYDGQGSQSLQYPGDVHVVEGRAVTVFFSSSHPWLSVLRWPPGVMFGGLPVVLFVWLIEVGLVTTFVKPSSRWAFDFSGRPGSGQRGILANILPHRRASDSLLVDKLKLVGWALLIILLMAGVVIGVNRAFGLSK